MSGTDWLGVRRVGVGGRSFMCFRFQFLFFSVSHHYPFLSLCFPLTSLCSLVAIKVLGVDWAKPHVWSVCAVVTPRQICFSFKGDLCLFQKLVHFSHKIRNWVFTFPPTQSQTSRLTSAERDYLILFSCSLISSTGEEWQTYIFANPSPYGAIHGSG